MLDLEMRTSLELEYFYPEYFSREKLVEIFDSEVKNQHLIRYSEQYDEFKDYILHKASPKELFEIRKRSNNILSVMVQIIHESEGYFTDGNYVNISGHNVSLSTFLFGNTIGDYLERFDNENESINYGDSEVPIERLDFTKPIYISKKELSAQEELIASWEKILASDKDFEPLIE